MFKEPGSNSEIDLKACGIWVSQHAPVVTLLARVRFGLLVHGPDVLLQEAALGEGVPAHVAGERAHLLVDHLDMALRDRFY
jgi:hypothetical protein